MIFETKRLYLRRFNLDDAKSLFLLNFDLDVIKYTGDKAFLNVDEAYNFIINYSHYKKYDFGRWAVIIKKIMFYRLVWFKKILQIR